MNHLRDFIQFIIGLNHAQSTAKPIYADSDMNSNFETPAASWLSLFLVMRGALEFNVGGRRRLVKAGELVGLNAHFANAGQVRRQPALYGCVSFDVTRRPAAERFARAPVLLCEPVCDPGYLHRLCRTLCRMTHMPPTHFPDIQVHAALQQTLVAMYEAIPPAAAHMPPGRGRIVREALRVIQERHTDPNLNLEQIAASVGVSVGHLEKRFRAEMAATPTRILAELRMARSRGLLSGTSSAIKNIATAVGFRDPLYFSRAFRRTAGMSPRQYRRQMKH